MTKFYIGNKKTEKYKGLLIKADLGLHAQIAKILLKKMPPAGKLRVLDLGAGEGALSQRLSDLGYSVIAADVSEDEFKCNDIEFYKINFDSSQEINRLKQKYKNHFDVVMGIEVIEHVENPWEYVRSLKSMLKKNGLLLITTPNTTSWLSRLYFLFKGQFWVFTDLNLEYGHIAPISPWEIKLILSREKISDIEIHPGGTLPVIWLAPSKTVLILNFLALFFRPLMSGIKDGWCIIVTGFKSD